MTNDVPDNTNVDEPIDGGQIPSGENRPTPKQPKSSVSRFRLSRLTLKELRETLRDRRTIVTLILMPLLVYPALSLVFKTFLLSNVGLLADGKPVVLHIAFDGPGEEEATKQIFQQFVGSVNQVEAQQWRKLEEEAKQIGDADSNGALAEGKDLLQSTMSGEAGATASPFAEFAAHKWAPVKSMSDLDLVTFVVQGGADVGVEFDTNDRKPWEFGSIRIIANGSELSKAASEYLEQKIKMLNELDLEGRLTRAGIPTGPAIKLTTDVVGAEEVETKKAFPLASLIPLILVMMTITGAVYPAIDLTAGERERGTLETLMAAPVPRFGILFSKFLAVLTVAVLTAVLNLIGMFATIWVFQLDKQLGGGNFDVFTMFQIFLLLILFAAFFSSLLLAVTSFAKSFKEAQVYLIPIILLSLGPGLIAMAPGMKLDGIYAITPMVNIILLARDVLQNEAELMPAIMAVVSTLMYAYLALQLAATIFGSDNILYSGSGSFADMFQRPAKVQRFVPVVATLFCLLMLLPINFASIGFIGRMSGDGVSNVTTRFMTMAFFTFLAFMVFPWFIARHQNANIKSAFGLNVPKPSFIIAGVLLGISLWPIVMFLIEGWHDLYGLIFGAEEQAAWHKRLVETTQSQVERVRQVPEWVIAICLSIVPAVCEEWFFRGMLQRSLLRRRNAVKAILISAFAFGLFHVLSNSVIAIDRLIPTTLIGIVLGYLAYKSNSIVPGILLHALNNACVVFVAYYQPRLSEYSWFPAEDEPVPVSWLIAGLAVAALGGLLLWITKRSKADADIHEE